MKLKYPFSTETRELFYPVRYKCFICGGNGSTTGGIELHHIFGRVSNSPYNGAPLCKRCHAKIGHSEDEEQKLLYKTKRYLNSAGYIPTEKDDVFLVKHEKIKYTSKKQTKGLFLWLTWIAKELSDAGIDMRTILEDAKDIDMPVTKDNLKRTLWNHFQVGMYDKTSHKDLKGDEFDGVQEAFSAYILKKYSVYIDFPSEELKAREKQAKEICG